MCPDGAPHLFFTRVGVCSETPGVKIVYTLDGSYPDVLLTMNQGFNVIGSTRCVATRRLRILQRTRAAARAL